MDVESAERLAGVLRALAEPTRLRLVSLVVAAPRGQACVCDLTDPVGLTQPTVSHHLKVLVDAGSSNVSSAGSGPTSVSSRGPWKPPQAC